MHARVHDEDLVELRGDTLVVRNRIACIFPGIVMQLNSIRVWMEIRFLEEMASGRFIRLNTSAVFRN